MLQILHKPQEVAAIQFSLNLPPTYPDIIVYYKTKCSTAVFFLSLESFTVMLHSYKTLVWYNLIVIYIWINKSSVGQEEVQTLQFLIFVSDNFIFLFL